jgi:ribose transport system ATP-binding protein
MKEHVLELRSITKAYPGVVALSDVDFAVRPGEVHALVGENGAGKSTLIKIIAGALQKDRGEMFLTRRPVAFASPAQMRAMGVSVIYQELSLIAKLDVKSNIFLGRERILDLPGLRFLCLRDVRKMETFCRALLSELEIHVDPNALVADLSVSDRQLVEIARAVAFQSRVILMDEPTTSLGHEEKAHLFALIRRLRARGIGIVYVSHILEDCLEVSDSITVLRDGKRIATLDRSEATVDELVRLITGRTFSERYPHIESRTGRNALELRGLTRRGLFEDISFEVHEGEIVGLCGLVGAGRTDLVHAIFGLDRVDAGEVRVFGEAVLIRNPRDAIRHGFSLLTEDRKTLGVLHNMTVCENIVITAINLWIGEVSNRLALFRQILRLGRAADFAKSMVRQIRVKTPSVNTRIVHLSGGNQQKVLLARALSAGARIIILDEPTKGVDAGAKIEIYWMLQALLRDGIALLVISSELPEIMALSNRVVIMKKGRVTANVPRDDVSGQEVLEHATR